MTQYGISSLVNIPDIRNRDVEILTEGGFSKKELLFKLKHKK